jgi:ethanolamine transporter EutH
MNKANITRFAYFGFLGGLIGTVMMDIVLFIEFYLFKMPIYTNYAVIGSAVGASGWIGFILHFIIGPALGLVFGVAIAWFDFLKITTLKKGILLGVLAGIITIPLGCVPTALLSHVPIINFVSFSAIPHLVWGSGLGWYFAYRVQRMRKNMSVNPQTGAHP